MSGRQEPTHVGKGGPQLAVEGITSSQGKSSKSGFRHVHSAFCVASRLSAFIIVKFGVSHVEREDLKVAPVRHLPLLEDWNVSERQKWGELFTSSKGSIHLGKALVADIGLNDVFRWWKSTLDQDPAAQMSTPKTHQREPNTGRTLSLPYSTTKASNRTSPPSVA